MKDSLTMGGLEPPIQRVGQLDGRVAQRGSAACCPAMEEF
jgi:hypothetical protein